MADQWYYTSEGRQMDPVSEGELRRLASRGLLKPTDLVWKEGMAKWERAGSHKDLFVSAAPAVEDEERYTVKDEPRGVARADDELESLSQRLKRKKKVVEEEDTEPEVEEEQEEYEERPRRRKKKKQSNAGLIWGLVGGGVGLVALVIGVIVIINLATGDSGPTRSWSLNQDGKRHFHLKFTAGKRVEIWVKSNQDSDVDLFVFPPNQPAKFEIAKFQEPRAVGTVAFDDNINKNCYVSFIAPASGSYEVVVWNRILAPQALPFAAKVNIRNQSNNGTMEFKESEPGAVAANPPGGKAPPVFNPGAPPIEPKPGVPNVNRPPRVLPVTLGPKLTLRSGIFSANDGQDPTKPGCYCQIYTCNLVMGKSYTIDLESPSKGKLDPFLRIEDAGGQQLAFDDDGGDFLNSRIVFQPPQNGMYRIIVTTVAPGMTGPFVLKIKQE